MKLKDFDFQRSNLELNGSNLESLAFSVVQKYKKEKNIIVSFTQDEIEKYFNGIPKHSLKEYIISIAKNIHDV